MRIAFFTDVLLPPDGGIEQHVLTTSQALAKGGNEVRVYAPDPLSRHPDPSSPSVILSAAKDLNSRDASGASDLSMTRRLEFVKGIPMPFVWPNFRFAFPLNLYFSFKKWKPEVIHFHTSGPMAWAGIILSKILKIKLVGTFHSYLMEKEYLENFKFQISNFKFSFEWVSPLAWFYVRSVFNCCDVVVSPSAWVAKDIKNHGIYKPIKVVHNGADLSQFGQEVSNEVVKKLRERYGLGENVLLYVGRLSREKGLDILFKTIQLLNSGPFSRHPEGLKTPKDLDSSGRTPQNDGGDDCKLLLVGNGPAEGELKKLASDLGILDNVVFLGRVNHSDLPGSGLFEVSKAFVTASASENQPLTIIEAMAKGLPIIGVSARGVTELVNGNGLLALPSDETDLANKIQQLLGNEEARIKMGEESRKMSHDYSLSKAAENLENLYQSI